MDLHLHTPASADWLEPGTTYLQWLQKAETRGLDMVAITDHNTVEGVARLRSEIERLTWLEANDRLRPQERRDLDEYRRLGEKILVLPGFEFTATFGFHILAIFPPETPLRTLELLLLRLNVPVDRLTEGSTEVGATADVLTAYRMIREAGGITIAAHANSAHGVAMRGLSFGGQTKIAFTQDPNLNALEVTDLEDSGRRATAHFFDGSKPEYPRRMHCIQGSDAHRLVRDPKDKNRPGIGDRVTELLLPEVTFEAMQALFEGDDFTRTRPYRPLAEQPFDHIEAAREKGNNIVQSFHESMVREAGRLHKVLCDVVAFGNTSGGTVYIGVSAARKGAPKGVESPEAAVVFLRKELERNITPPLDARVEVVLSQGVPVVQVIVPNGTDKPYALAQTRIYVRQEGETNEAMRDELVQLVLAGRQLSATPAVEQPATPEPRQPVAAVPEPVAAPEPMAVPIEPGPDGLQLPGIGVEIVAAEERKGTRYFTIRDLRNSNTVQNVTLASARKLWSYAINQYLTNPLDATQVTWRDDYGVWQVARRAKKLRYDLVLRQSDGSVRVFYGVTADGMIGPWAQFLRAEDKGEAEPQAQVAPKAEVKAKVVAEAQAEGAAAAPVAAVQPTAAKPRSRSRTRKPKAESKPEAPAQVAAEAKPEPAPPVEAPVVVEVKAAPAAEAQPEAPAPAKSRSRSRKPKVVESVEAQPVEATPKPKSRSQSQKAKPAEAVAAQPSEAAPQPPSRSRSRKPKAKNTAESQGEQPAPAA
ncbi:MAG: putative DNA binding domain-containing protein [Chloroflexi bacterium]|nr:putative DNA binding domain-containing protein [Chloroflexota bacterium]